MGLWEDPHALNIKSVNRKMCFLHSRTHLLSQVWAEGVRQLERRYVQCSLTSLVLQLQWPCSDFSLQHLCKCCYSKKESAEKFLHKHLLRNSSLPPYPSQNSLNSAFLAYLWLYRLVPRSHCSQCFSLPLSTSPSFLFQLPSCICLYAGLSSRIR